MVKKCQKNCFDLTGQAKRWYQNIQKPVSSYDPAWSNFGPKKFGHFSKLLIPEKRPLFPGSLPCAVHSGAEVVKCMQSWGDKGK